MDMPLWLIWRCVNIAGCCDLYHMHCYITRPLYAVSALPRSVSVATTQVLCRTAQWRGWFYSWLFALYELLAYLVTFCVYPHMQPLFSYGLCVHVCLTSVYYNSASNWSELFFLLWAVVTCTLWLCIHPWNRWIPSRWVAGLRKVLAFATQWSSMPIFAELF